MTRSSHPNFLLLVSLQAAPWVALDAAAPRRQLWEPEELCVPRICLLAIGKMWKPQNNSSFHFLSVTHAVQCGLWGFVGIFALAFLQQTLHVWGGMRLGEGLRCCLNLRSQERARCSHPLRAAHSLLTHEEKLWQLWWFAVRRYFAQPEQGNHQLCRLCPTNTQWMLCKTEGKWFWMCLVFGNWEWARSRW